MSSELSAWPHKQVARVKYHFVRVFKKTGKQECSKLGLCVDDLRRATGTIPDESQIGSASQTQCEVTKLRNAPVLDVLRLCQPLIELF